MIILLTNDDGIDSSRLAYTREILKKYGTVYTVAPTHEQSAKSMSLTFREMTFHKIDDFTYSVDGTPVDCVKFAHAGLKLKPDLVVSGTNKGHNIGIDTRYSGTVGAVLQAQYYGYPSIALSGDRRSTTLLENELENTLNYIFEKQLPSNEYTINVNFPDDTLEKAKGIKETKLHNYVFPYTPKIEGNKFYPKRSFVYEGDLPQDSDTLAFNEGYISISKISL